MDAKGHQDGPAVRMWSSMFPADTAFVPSIFRDFTGGSSGFGCFPAHAQSSSASSAPSRWVCPSLMRR